MVAVRKPVLQVIDQSNSEHPLVQLGLFCAAGLLVGVLCLTYGIDLSPGLF